MFIQSDIVIKQYPNMLVVTNAGGFPVGVDTDNILSVNSMPRSRRISEVLQKTGHVEKSGQGIDRMFAISISEGKPIPDYSLTDEWQVCLRLYGTIQDPALLLLIHDIHTTVPQKSNSTLSIFLPSTEYQEATASAMSIEGHRDRNHRTVTNVNNPETSHI